MRDFVFAGSGEFPRPGMSAALFNRFLLVDDDARLRDRLAKALRERGYAVEIASDAHGALAAACANAPDAVVLDLKMPGPSGLDVLRDLRSAAPAARILILTGYGSIATALEAVRLGAWEYLMKPADADQIISALSHDPTLQTPGPQEPRPELMPPSLERMEWEHIQRVLSDCRGNISKAARILGLHRRSLQRKVQKYPPPR